MFLVERQVFGGTSNNILVQMLSDFLTVLTKKSA